MPEVAAVVGSGLVAWPNTFADGANAAVVTAGEPPNIEVVDGAAVVVVDAPKAANMFEPADAGGLAANVEVTAVATGLHTFRPWKSVSVASAVVLDGGSWVGFVAAVGVGTVAKLAVGLEMGTTKDKCKVFFFFLNYYNFTYILRIITKNKLTRCNGRRTTFLQRERKPLTWSVVAAGRRRTGRRHTCTGHGFGRWCARAWCRRARGFGKVQCVGKH